MKKITLIALVLTSLSVKSWAHCPNEFEHEGENFCLDYSWERAQQKMKGEYFDTDSLSPVINKESLASFKRKTSTAFFNLWAKGDSTHKSVFLNDFRVFPYMQMTNGAHHSASSLTEYVSGHVIQGENKSIEPMNGYLVSRMALLDMKVGGCWSFRATFSKNNDVKNSFKINNIEGYTNITPEKNFDLLTLCELCGQGESPVGGGEDHHEHH